MASQQDIKRRIQSVRNTRKITKALELVSASKLRRAQARIEALRPYADRMQQLTVDVAAAAGDLSDQPLLARRDVKTVAVVALTGATDSSAAIYDLFPVRSKIVKYRTSKRRCLEPNAI